MLAQPFPWVLLLASASAGATGDHAAPIPREAHLNADIHAATGIPPLLLGASDYKAWGLRVSVSQGFDCEDVRFRLTCSPEVAVPAVAASEPPEAASLTADAKTCDLVLGIGNVPEDCVSPRLLVFSADDPADPPLEVPMQAIAAPPHESVTCTLGRSCVLERLPLPLPEAYAEPGTTLVPEPSCPPDDQHTAAGIYCHVFSGETVPTFPYAYHFHQDARQARKVEGDWPGVLEITLHPWKFAPGVLALGDLAQCDAPRTLRYGDLLQPAELESCSRTLTLTDAEQGVAYKACGRVVVDGTPSDARAFPLRFHPGEDSVPTTELAFSDVPGAVDLTRKLSPGTTVREEVWLDRDPVDSACQVPDSDQKLGVFDVQIAGGVPDHPAWDLSLAPGTGVAYRPVRDEGFHELSSYMDIATRLQWRPLARRPFPLAFGAQTGFATQSQVVEGSDEPLTWMVGGVVTLPLSHMGTTDVAAFTVAVDYGLWGALERTPWLGFYINAASVRLGQLFGNQGG